LDGRGGKLVAPVERETSRRGKGKNRFRRLGEFAIAESKILVDLQNLRKVTLAASAFVFAGLFSFGWSEQSAASRCQSRRPKRGSVAR
jgi:hypothetical protein